jgi:hypothetical protein
VQFAKVDDLPPSFIGAEHAQQVRRDAREMKPDQNTNVHLTHYISFVAGISSPDTPHRLSLLREVANALAKPTRSHEDNIIILACSIFTKKNQFCVTTRTAGPYEAS